LITFETIIFTVITFVLVAVILAGYVSVLKKNGWIGKTSFEKDFKTSSFRSQPEFKAQNAFGSFIEVKEPKPKEEGKEPQNQKDKPAVCNHYFGYLSTLPKMAAPPEECYFCAKLLECYKEMKN